MSIEKPNEQEKHINDLRREIMDFIAKDQSTGESGHFLSADEMYISPEDRMKYLTDEDIIAFEKYYKRFQNVIETGAELSLGKEELESILAEFEKEKYSASGNGPNLKHLSRADLWAFLSNKISRLQYKLYLLKHPDKAEKLVRKKK